ncbi:MAG: hypothetical protein AAF587_15335 [Bacteroidota bacterium]
MTRSIFSLCIIFFVTTNIIHAQTKTDKQPNNQLYLGFTAGMYGLTDFQQSPPFDVQTPLYVGPTWIRNNLAVSPFYNIGGHSVGMFVTYAISKDLSTYLIIDDALNADQGFYGVGITTPIIDPYVVGFVEIDRTYGEVGSTPALLLGVWVSLGKKVAAW